SIIDKSQRNIEKKITMSLSTEHAPSAITRPCANFPPSFWGDSFLQYDSESLVLYFTFEFAIFYFYLLTNVIF
ncbi:hypothetical protein VIGAN_07118800, partial [Vigna angularis var. angularis]